MALTLAWEVTGLKTQDQTNADGVTLTDAVVQTYWKCTGTDENGNEGSFSGATPFTAENTPEGSFTAFSSLTEATVLGWIQAVVVGGYLDHVQEQIQKQIDANTIQDATMPWAPVEEE
ncbi:MAG: hypothetical protein VW270_30545 [Candidatus Poseidoniales archaeon]